MATKQFTTLSDGDNSFIVKDSTARESVSALQAVVNELDAENAKLTIIARAFSTSTSYKVGEYVIYNKMPYRCKTAHSAGAWNASHFTGVIIGNELTRIITYMQTTITLSTSSSVSATFSSSEITTSSAVDVYANVYGMRSSSVTITSGKCVVTFPANQSVTSLQVRIYIR